jgi:hypothetical protein
VVGLGEAGQHADTVLSQVILVQTPPIHTTHPPAGTGTGSKSRVVD